MLALPLVCFPSVCTTYCYQSQVFGLGRALSSAAGHFDVLKVHQRYTEVYTGATGDCLNCRDLVQLSFCLSSDYHLYFKAWI